MKRFILLGLFLLQTGCASILQGDPDKILINTYPNSARVYLNGVPKGYSPVEIRILREDDAVLDIKNDGYEPIHTELHKVVNGWVFLDGAFGIIIDLALHNQGKYSENPLFFQMQREGIEPKGNSVIEENDAKKTPSPRDLPRPTAKDQQFIPRYISQYCETNSKHENEVCNYVSLKDCNELRKDSNYCYLKQSQ